MKVISTSPSFAKYDNTPIVDLQKNGFEYLAFPADVSLDELKPHLKDTVAIIVAFTEINDKLLDLAPNLKIVCKHGVGVDNIDLNATKNRNIWVTNVPNANKHAVADFAFTLLLGAARQLPQAVEKTKKGEWPRIFATDAYGKTIGILGLGNIGKQVALRARGFNMQILAYDPYPDHAFAKEFGVTFVSLDELTERSDFISIHMPLIESTNNLFNLERIKRMKKGAFLMNLSRGGIVNEADLYRALSDKIIAGAASDVFVEEPLTEHPLFALDNFIGTPHIAGYTDGAVSAIGELCVENIINCLVHGRKPIYVVNGL
ncbi:phosphoglycerate dehydrogenase [Zophobihabitans entericus]|uniref:Phosphoglycerate dehydrogenase n=1 Tax=Zophobihabitans entericus TaxID=1635327 RepID=A0A6G9IAD0_9GAMM|nr:phosphoglycerate dehydrogenase [Zophobihabitans entericus]QIQ21181.1 phosphoglycerate dehydrogenase [Zophobihabitans entericus]